MSEQGNISIRQPEASELVMVQALRRADTQTGEPLPLLNELDDADFHERTIHMAAFSDDEPVATVRLDSAHPDRGGYYFVREMRTHPAHRQRGIGSLVLAAAERVAVEKGTLFFGLDSPEPAIPFYEKQGYKNTTLIVKSDDGSEMSRMTKKARP